MNPTPSSGRPTPSSEQSGLDLLSLSRYRFRLGWKIGAWIAGIFLVFVSTQFLLLREITQRRFQAIERTGLLDRTRQILLAFERDSEALQSLTVSMAAWRDTYAFMQHPDAGYVDRNFSDEWPRLYNIDFVLFVDNEGRKVWSSEGYPSFRAAMPQPFTADHFERTDPFVFPLGTPPRPTDASVGLIASGNEAWIYCVQAITNDDMSASARGVMVLGRLIDQEMLTSFTYGRKDGLDLVGLPQVPSSSDHDDRMMAGAFPSFGVSRTIIQRENGALVSYAPLVDMAGRPIGALKLSVLRNMEAAGERLVWFTSASLMLVGLLMMGAILVAVRTMVIKPIARLTAYFSAHEEGREVALQMPGDRRDEIGFLANRAVSLMAKVKEQKAELENLANTDRLTGLANRRRFETHIRQEMRRILRHRRGSSAQRDKMAVVVIDVDHFKLYNDTYGHVAGDVCLRGLAEAIQSCTHRPGDLACRFGGEEFVLVLPDTDESGARVVAESVRQAVLTLAMPHEASGVSPFVTVSAGVAALEVVEPFDVNALIQQGDQALYAAKHQGRNRVVAFSSMA